jgi:ribosomal protein L7/L12
MEPLFNQYGNPSEPLSEVAAQIEQISRNFLLGLVEKGYTATEIRAASGYIVGSAELSGAEAILMLQAKIHSDRIKNADPNLNDSEKGLASSGEKIQAIKNYRERTGNGLREAKDIVEKWMNENGIK